MPTEAKNLDLSPKYSKNRLRSFELHPRRCTLVERNEDIPSEIDEKLNQLGTNYISDRYLFETAWLLPKNEPKIIITTDEKLRNQMIGNDYFDVVLLTDFLKSY